MVFTYKVKSPIYGEAYFALFANFEEYAIEEEFLSDAEVYEALVWFPKVQCAEAYVQQRYRTGKTYKGTELYEYRFAKHIHIPNVYESQLWYDTLEPLYGTEEYSALTGLWHDKLKFQSWFAESFKDCKEFMSAIEPTVKRVPKFD
mgnify:CR=1 FL=1